MNTVPLYVRVECDAFSRYRDPSGVYKVDAIQEQSLLHSACAAIQIVKDCAAFIEENAEKLILRVFSHDGDEIMVPRMVDPMHHEEGSFEGRAIQYPEMIILQ